MIDTQKKLELLSHFKAWDKYNQKMCYVVDLKLVSQKAEVIEHLDKINEKGHYHGHVLHFVPEKDENEVGFGYLIRGTGLRDRNGKFIFAGDILSFRKMRYVRHDQNIDSDYSLVKASPKLCVVSWSAEPSGALVGFALDGGSSWGGAGFLTAAKARKAHVVGNIYENPNFRK
jgi:uncharacterized phage protein (TIGR01671 family)